ncbi:MAG: hypothetical protein J4F41_08650, partial [Alphaproteobacteria bacterium]|nr:hypothetical protein [Alphaproteobacteria bacterium]
PPDRILINDSEIKMPVFSKCLGFAKCRTKSSHLANGGIHPRFGQGDGDITTPDRATSSV